MANLLQLFALNDAYRGQTYSRFDIIHAGINVMSIELHKPKPTIPNGYFSAYWPTVLDNLQGKKALAESYARLRTRFEFPNGSEKLLAEYKKMYGDDVELCLTIGTDYGNSAHSKNGSCSLDNRILELGLVVNNETLGGMVQELIESTEIPKDFSFLRFDSPFCSHYFGITPFVNDRKEAGLMSHVNLSEELVELYMETGYHNMPVEHLPLLIELLNKTFWRLNHLDRPLSIT